MQQKPHNQAAQPLAFDPIWLRVRAEAEDTVAQEPALARFIWETVLNHDRLEDAVVHRLAERLDHPTVRATLIRQTFEDLQNKSSPKKKRET